MFVPVRLIFSYIENRQVGCSKLHEHESNLSSNRQHAQQNLKISA